MNITHAQVLEAVGNMSKAIAFREKLIEGYEEVLKTSKLVIAAKDERIAILEKMLAAALSK